MKRIVAAFFFQIATAMLIPEEIEMLNGYNLISSFPEALPEDEYFEARSLSFGPLFNSVRNKRDIKYDMKESVYGQMNFDKNKKNVKSIKESENENSFMSQKNSSFRKVVLPWLKKKNPHDDSDESSNDGDITLGKIVLFPKRKRRSAEKHKNDKNVSSTSTHAESMSNDKPKTAALVGKFTRSPFEYSKIQHEEDSMAMDTTSLNINEGMKSRTPRVNFVTQQKKSLDHDETKVSSTKSDFYKTPPLLHNSKETSDERSSTIRPLFNNNHYDDRYIEDMYNSRTFAPSRLRPEVYEYNEVPFDIYMRRPFYPKQRYYDDNMQSTFRDYPPMYVNELDDYYHMHQSDMLPPPPMSHLPRKRTIYYAYLPEVVRNTPTGDFRYRSYDRHDNYYPNYYENSFKYDYRTSRPMKIYDDEMKENKSLLKEKRFNHDISNNENKMSMRSQSYGRHNSYDSFYY